MKDIWTYMYQYAGGLLFLASFDTEEAAYTFASTHLASNWRDEAEEYVKGDCYLQDLDLESAEALSKFWNHWRVLVEAGDKWLLVHNTLNPETIQDGSLII